MQRQYSVSDQDLLKLAEEAIVAEDKISDELNGIDTVLAKLDQELWEKEKRRLEKKRLR